MKHKVEVMNVRERDMRFQDVQIETETEKTMTGKVGKRSKRRTLRFIKLGRGFTSEAGRRTTRFIGKEGTAYTTLPHGSGELVPLASVIEAIWGEEYNKLKPEMRTTLEKGVVNVTVELEKGTTPEGYQVVTQEEVTREIQQEEVAEIRKKYTEKGSRLSEMIKDAFIMSAGALIMAIVFMLKIIVIK